MAGKIHRPMDKFFKRSFKDVRVMRELLQAHFSQDVLKNMDLSTLKIEKNTFVSKDYQNSETDLLYSVRYKDTTAFVYILCEMQGTIDEDMLLRLMGYLHSFYDLYRKQHQKNRCQSFILSFYMLEKKSGMRP